MAWRKWLVRGLVLTILGAVGAAVCLYIRWTNPASGTLYTLRGWLGHHASSLGEKIPFGDVQNNQSMTFAVGYVLAFLIVMWVMYRLKIFIKV